LVSRSVSITAVIGERSSQPARTDRPNIVDAMKAVILAGGAGTRISEESVLRPKPMIEIGGKPILWHTMRDKALPRGAVGVRRALEEVD